MSLASFCQSRAELCSHFYHNLLHGKGDKTQTQRRLITKVLWKIQKYIVKFELISITICDMILKVIFVSYSSVIKKSYAVF